MNSHFTFKELPLSDPQFWGYYKVSANYTLWLKRFVDGIKGEQPLL